ncbi:MAG: flagellar assembly protein T N-terminal domain-containing protein [Myxococcales bacterium]|jgi:hypothetical protein
MKKSLLAALSTLVLGAGGAWAAEQVEAKVVTVKGEAAINNDLPAAKERAKEAALREAVNQVVGATVTSVSEMQDFSLVRDIVFSQTAGYVSEYNLVSEQVDQENDLVTVTYQVKVAKGEIDKDAAAVATLLAMKKQKRVFVMVKDISTDTVGEGSAKTATVISHGMFEGELRRALRGDGFTLLDPNLDSGKLKVESAIQAINNPQQARELGNALGADLVVYGTVTASNIEEDAFGQRMHKAVLRISLVAVAPDSGEIVADYVETVEGAVAHSFPVAANNVLKKATASAVKELRSELYSAWRKQATSAQSVVVEVNGVSFAEFSAFKSLLETSVRGVKAVSSSRLEKGVGRFEIQMAGSAEALAAALSDRSFRGKTLSVTTLGPNTVGLVLGR